jgi:hypothetical protein
MGALPVAVAAFRYFSCMVMAMITSAAIRLRINSIDVNDNA